MSAPTTQRWRSVCMYCQALLDGQGPLLVDDIQTHGACDRCIQLMQGRLPLRTVGDLRTMLAPFKPDTPLCFAFAGMAFEAGVGEGNAGVIIELDTKKPVDLSEVLTGRGDT